MTLPDHLQPLPADAVQALCNRVGAEELPYGVMLELEAFCETGTPHDARRLANALRHVMRREDLARELEALTLQQTE